MTTEAPAVHPQLIELPELTAAAPATTLVSANAALFDGISIALTVVVGQIETTLGALMKLGESTVLEVDRAVNAPVDVVVNGTVVARGNLVVVGDNFGVRVSEVALAKVS